MTIADNVAQVRHAIAAACRACGRNPATVRLIAVTKSQGPAVLPELAEQGVHEFGENRIDHLAEMAQHAPAGSQFHHIGRIQSRQIPEIARWSSCVHGVTDADHARRLARACAALGRRMPIFIQVNTSGEATKAGGGGDALPPLLDAVRALPDLDLLGLMTMAPPVPEGADRSCIRATFAALRQLAHQHGLARLSMGMSDDFAEAIAEGATDIRIGTRLFV